MVCYWSLFFDKKGEALIYCAKSEDEQYEITPKFYTSMNYYRFVRPGMVRCGAESPDEALLVSAFRSKDKGGARVIVVVNTADEPKTTALGVVPARGWRRYETTETKKCEQTPCREPTVVFPARSVTTFVWGAREAQRKL